MRIDDITYFNFESKLWLFIPSLAPFFNDLRTIRMESFATLLIIYL